MNEFTDFVQFGDGFQSLSTFRCSGGQGSVKRALWMIGSVGEKWGSLGGSRLLVVCGKISHSVTGAFRPYGLVFTRPCKFFQTKVFKEKKLKEKRIHVNLILLRVTFSIIVLKSLRRIARRMVFALISFFL